jgi:carboxyl-terminal processing protease
MRRPSLAALLAATALALAACGGGGGGGGGTVDPAVADRNGIGLPASASLAGRCTAGEEKAFLRSWIDETYLWYRDVRALPAATLDPAAAATPLDYFAVLKSTERTATGKPKDQFHFTYPTAVWQQLSQQGVALGYGFEVALVARTVPRRAVVAFTEPGSPAAAAGIGRGAEILAVDGVDVATNVDPAPINAALFPTAPGSHVFRLRDAGATAERTVTLAAQAIARDPVQNVRTLPAPNQRVGYLLFNDHVATAEGELVAAIAQLRAAGVDDLVLDIRYNGGGLLSIASQLAYMVAGPGPTAGKTFERLLYNDRNPFGVSDAGSRQPFFATTRGLSTTAGQPLPTLDLPRVFVLAGGDTCSASESIVNGLRGAGVTVVHVGGRTCGKPYGFYPEDNCGTTYFAIQFQGVNEQGFGDYADGFAPTCTVADDFSRALGDPLEDQLDTALGYRATGTCAPLVGRSGVAASKLRATAPAGAALLARTPERENRLLER